MAGLGLSANISLSNDKYQSSDNRLDKKTIIVTGGTSGIGEKTVQNLTIKHGAKVIIPSRDLKKCEESKVAHLNQYKKWVEEPNSFEKYFQSQGDPKKLSNPENLIECRYCDLKSFKSVKEFADSIEKVDALINNAGVMKPKPTTTIKKTLIFNNSRKTSDNDFSQNESHQQHTKVLYFKTAETADNLEETLQVNALSHQLLSKLLKNKLEKSTLPNETTKIVNVTCAAQKYGIINFSDLSKTSTLDRDEAQYDYRGLELYKASKLATVLLSKEMAKSWPSLNVTCIDPGVASDSAIGRDIENTQGLTSYLNKYINPGYYLSWITTSRTSNQCSRDILALLFEKSENGHFFVHNERALNLLKIDEVVDRQNNQFRDDLKEQFGGDPASVPEDAVLKRRRNYFGNNLDLDIYSDSFSKILWKYGEMVSDEVLES